ncbi:MAG: protein kinase [Polyangiales bacterium]
MLDKNTVLGARYRILRLLGEGGMGAVYEAEHLTVHRRVAVKVLLPEHASNPAIVERFVREARAAVSIGHDNIVEVSDFGEDNGLHYMVMELLRGESLASRISALGKLPIPMAAAIMGQTLSALAAAHACGIVHRDLKPENVFLTTKVGIVDFVKLLDFGISKFQSATWAEPKALTRTGTTLGTPYYMAPEQALGRREVDHRADLFAAGAMLYEMITGNMPFSGESQAEIFLAVIYRQPPLKGPREHDPSIPEALEAAILKALAVDADQRFASAAEFLDALRPFGATAVIAPMNAPRNTPSPPSNTPQPEPAHTVTDVQIGEAVVPSAGEATSSQVIELARPKHRAPRRFAAFAAASLGLLAVTALGLALRHPETASTQRDAAITTAREVRLDLVGVPDEATIEIDGAPASSRSPVFIAGSSHVLRVTAPGRLPFEHRLQVDHTQSLAVVLAPAPSPTAQTPPLPAPSAPETARPSSVVSRARPAPPSTRPRAARTADSRPSGQSATTSQATRTLPLDTHY